MLESIPKNQKETVDIPQSAPTQETTNDWEYVQLPSQGVFYKNQYKGIKQLKVRKLNWEDDDILTTKSYYDNGTLFLELLKNTIIDENEFPHKHLVNVDKDTILWWLRKNEFGKDYKVPYKCEHCDNEFPAIWDLDSFKTPVFPKEYEQELLETGCATITLPQSQLKVKITNPSVGGELELFNRMKAKKEKIKSSRDFNITGKLMSVIKTAWNNEGKEYDSTSIGSWLNTGYNGNKIPLSDSRYIQEKAREIELRTNTEQDLACPHCEHIHSGVEIPMTIYFFYPSFKGKE